MEFYSYFHGYYIRRSKRVDDRFESKIEIKKKKEGEEKEKRGKFVKFAMEGLTRTEEARKERRIKVIMTGCEREIEIGGVGIVWKESERE